MKNLKNLLAILILILIVACSKDDGPSPTILKANNISPNTVPKNTIVTIKGTGFSDITANILVTLNGKNCTVIKSLLL